MLTSCEVGKTPTFSQLYLQNTLVNIRAEHRGETQVHTEKEHKKITYVSKSTPKTASSARGKALLKPGSDTT